MKRLKKLCSALLCAALLFTACPVTSPVMTAVAEGNYPTLAGTPADEWTALFDRRSETATWLGADGIYSVALSGNDAIGSATKDTKTFFIFSDSLMGTSDADGNVTWAPGQPSQTSAVLTGNAAVKDNIRFVWGPGGNGQFGSNKHLFGEHKWMLDCFVVGDAVYIFGFPEQDWKPKQIDMIKIPINKDGEPDYAKYSKTAAIEDLWYRDGDTALYAYGVGVTPNTVSAGASNPDGYIYIYGYRDAMQEFSRKDMIVSRIKETDFPDFTKTTYWDGSKWSDNIADSAPILRAVSCEFSVTPITSGPYKDKWIAIYTQNTESSDMMYAIADTPTGPFRNPTCFYKAPEHGQADGGMYTYNAKAHPHLSSNGKLLVSYNCNNRNTFGRQTTVEYHPRFLWIDLDPLGQGDYGAEEKDPNLAYLGAPIASSSAEPVSRLTDGDRDSAWKAASGKTADEWFGILWAEAKKVGRLEVYWNVNRAAPDGYTVELTADGETWEAAEVTSTRVDEGDWKFADTVILKTAATVKGVRIKVSRMENDLAGNPKADLECRELEVYTGLPVTPGDLDGDGEITASDLTALARHVAGIETVTDAHLLANAELDGVSGISAEDLTKLARKVAHIE